MKDTCLECGFEGEFPTEYRGSLIAEIILWIFAAVTFFTIVTPLTAVYYSMFRMDPDRNTCPKCGRIREFYYHHDSFAD